MDRVLITGASGFLGSRLGLHLADTGIEVLGLFHSNPKLLPFSNLQLDMADREAVRKLSDTFGPSVIVHCAALSRVLDCERDPELAQRINVRGTEHVAELSRCCSAHLIYISTDQVFDGQRGLRREDEPPSPTHVYGRCKVEAEQVAQSVPESLVLRSNNIVGRTLGWGSSFTDGILRRLRRSEIVRLFSDQYRSPIHVSTLVEVIRRCIVERKSGILHAGGPKRLSRYETGVELARAYGYPESLVAPESLNSHPQQETLHRDGSFDSSLLSSYWPELGNEEITVGFKRDLSEVVR